jgi:hypothetical protein
VYLALASLWAGLSIGAGPKPAAPDGPPAPLTPQEAAKRFKVADGLAIGLAVSEPEVAQPLSISFDGRGRMWVLQYRQYPLPEGLKAVGVDRYLRTRYDRVPEPPPRGPKGRDRILQARGAAGQPVLLEAVAGGIHPPGGRQPQRGARPDVLAPGAGPLEAMSAGRQRCAARLMVNGKRGHFTDKIAH